MISARIVARAPATLSHRFSATGAAGVSVTVTDAAGITRVTDAAATPLEGDTTARTWTYALPAAAVPTPTLLTVEWDADDGWVETDVIDVAGGRYVTVEEVKAGAHDDRGINRVDDATIASAITAAEDRIEKATLVPFVPRFASLRMALDGGGVRTVPQLREIVAARIDGADADFSQWSWSPSGFLVGSYGYGQVLELDVIHGYDRPPADLVDAAIRAVREIASGKAGSRIPATAESMSGGGLAFNFGYQADLTRGRPFGIPDVDAVVMSRREPVPVLA